MQLENDGNPYSVLIILVDGVTILNSVSFLFFLHPAVLQMEKLVLQEK